MAVPDASNVIINPPKDPNTLSNYTNFRVDHTTVDLHIDFDQQVLKGKVSLDLKSISNAGTKEIVLDSSYLDVSSVKVNGKSAEFEFLSEVKQFGTPLKIKLDQSVEENSSVKVEIDVSTTSQCTALQWFQPSQTSTGKHPYMFSQCQAIHARSIFPCQDTPGVKSTFDFHLRSKLPVVASGLPNGIEEVSGSDEKIYKFHQKVPISSYLFAIASGEIEGADIGPRSQVWTSPDQLAACKWEFENDMEYFLKTIEKIVYPYAWGTYNILVLPPSFPYGGMENPVYTFATPTAVTGDRENVDLIAHELSHAWSGNLVSPSSWEHSWLNEGWTTYLERRLMRALHGEPRRAFSIAMGWKGLQDAVKNFGPEHEFTKLIIDLKGVDPDEAFSKVAYEKGSAFLYHFERLIGMEKWDTFIPHYFKVFKNKALDSYDFKSCLLDFFAKDTATKQLLESVDWDKWFYGPGLPEEPYLADTSLIDVCESLAEKWWSLVDGSSRSGPSTPFEPSPSDIKSWVSSQSSLFLDRIEQFPKPLTPKLVRVLDEAYGFGKTQNIDVLHRFYVIGMRARDESVYQPTADLLGKVGRMLYVRPLFVGLEVVDRKRALQVYEKNKNFYHPICRAMVERLLFKSSYR